MYCFRDEQNADDDLFTVLESMFDNWSADYDRDVLAVYEYEAPASSAWMVYKHVKRSFDKDLDLQQRRQQTLEDRLSGTRVLDVASGTGLVGRELVKLGMHNLEAADLSRKMLQEAEKRNIYRALHHVVLGKRADDLNNDQTLERMGTYDVSVSS
jgi:predicted TPR repeat methyltransferase